MNIDLHTHSSVSDGKLSPLEIVRQARLAGVEMLSITDHDTVAAYTQIKDQGPASLAIIAGVEFSTQWKRTGIHILGLNIKPDSDAIHCAVAIQHDARLMRAQRIADNLRRLGIENAWEGAKLMAGDSVIGRPHFARFLVDSGVVRDFNEAFRKYLGAGKAGDVRQYWAPMASVVQWIRDAGGIAVLAHPDKYQLTNTKLSLLLDDFSDSGGEGMEVISGRQSTDVTSKLANLCRQKALLASCGSDFHQLGQCWAELGRVAALPLDCKAVWERWT